MRYPNNRAARIALGLVIAGSCAAACTLMKPSHEDLSGGEDDTSDATVDVAPDASVEPDASEAEAATDDASDSREDSDPADADAAPDGPSDAQTADAPPLTCDAGGKVCQNECVEVDDPEFGCGLTGCQACALASADAGCLNGKCSIAACNSGYLNCDDASVNGCEIDTQTDPKNCGACGKICEAPLNMTAQCVAGQCAAPVCESGWSDCDTDGGVDGGIDGCETATDSDPDHCGSCGTACPEGDNGARECVDGKCGFKCQPGFGACDSDPTNGCETQTGVDPLHCGGCGHECTYAHATAQCMFGGCRLGTCESLWGDCNMLGFDGCEKDLSSDKSNCGGCWKKCVGGQVCLGGTCQ